MFLHRAAHKMLHSKTKKKTADMERKSNKNKTIFEKQRKERQLGRKKALVKEGKGSPASNRKRHCSSGSSERSNRCQWSALRKKDKSSYVVPDKSII